MEITVVQKLSILDLDAETVAAGFADPDWVPQKITCVAWSWIGEEEVHARVCTPLGLFGKPELRKKMLIPLLDAIQAADILTGHNLMRFDLPVINSECMRLGLPVLPDKLVQDTMRVAKSKGFKKGQDNLGRLFGVKAEKMALDWQAWQDAYDQQGWETIIERCKGDIIQHKEIRDKILAQGYLKDLALWESKKH